MTDSDRSVNVLYDDGIYDSLIPGEYTLSTPFQKVEKFPPTTAYLVFSAIGCLIFPCMGVFGVAFSVMAHVSRQRDRRTSSVFLARIAHTFIILTFVVGICMWILVIVAGAVARIEINHSLRHPHKLIL